MGKKEGKILSGMETDAIGEILNISLGSSATSVSRLLGQPVNITTPSVEVMKTRDFDVKTYEPAVGVEINYIKGLDGQNILIMKESDIKVMVGLLLKTDFSDKKFEMNEMNVGAICEVMNQMMGASATALSQFLNRSIMISPPNAFLISNSEKFKNKYFENDEDIVVVYFNLMIGKLINSKFIHIMRIDLAKELISNFGLNDASDAGPALKSLPHPSAEGKESPENSAGTLSPAEKAGPASKEDLPLKNGSAPLTAEEGKKESASPESPGSGADSPPQKDGKSVPGKEAPAKIPYPEASPAPEKGFRVRGAVYPVFGDQKAKLNQDESSNLKMILSVPLQVTVELGRTTKKINEILDFSSGTIVELGRPAGSQVDVYVNGKAIGIIFALSKTFAGGPFREVFAA